VAQLTAVQQSVGLVSLLVRDYDEALAFYVGLLGFTLIEDTELPAENKRWVVVAPEGSKGAHILLARASDDRQITRIGNQTGGRVFLFLYTENFESDYSRYVSRGVKFIREKVCEAYGTVAVFQDLYGNQWDLIQKHQS
jgi:catechol 2,3-dioxygenase-like lactoylglutathione lyase family enzyme